MTYYITVRTPGEAHYAIYSSCVISALLAAAYLVTHHHHFPKIQPVAPTNANSNKQPGFRKAFMSFACSRQFIQKPLKATQASSFFSSSGFKELLKTRAGVLLRSLRQEVYKMLRRMTARGRGTAEWEVKRRIGKEEGESERQIVQTQPLVCCAA